jgi:hypothetical protein
MLKPVANTVAYSWYELLTVQGLLTLLTTAGIIIMTAQQTTIPTWYITAWGLMLGYYFRGVTSVQPLTKGEVITTMEQK